MPRKKKQSKPRQPKRRATKLKYTVEEFLDRSRALPIVRKYEHISRGFNNGQDQVEVEDNQTFEIHALRVMDYFHQVCPDKEEAREKSVLFLAIVPLLRSVDHHYTKYHPRDLPPDKELVNSIKDMARRLSANK